MTPAFSKAGAVRVAVEPFFGGMSYGPASADDGSPDCASLSRGA